MTPTMTRLLFVCIALFVTPLPALEIPSVADLKRIPCADSELLETLGLSKQGSAGDSVNTATDVTGFVFDHSKIQVQLTQVPTRQGISRSAITVSDSNALPVIWLLVDIDCNLLAERRIVYTDGEARHLEIRDGMSNLVAVQELDAPIPDYPDYNGVTVAMVDSGIDYRIDAIAARLARSPDGKALGYDFWDLDHHPFDHHSTRNAFFPRRHGTRTASLLLDESPFIRLIPYRYPRPDMNRMKDLVEHAASHGVRVMGLPIGSGNSDDWAAFRAAAQQHPDILFIISAGNEGLNIADTPRYPAVLNAENFLVVGSADQYPRPAFRTNWSRDHVDLLIPAERVPALDFGGASRLVSGTSYSVSRIVALASRLIALEGLSNTGELKQRIVSMSTLDAGNDFARHGTLLDPLSDIAEVTVTATRKRPASTTLNPLRVSIVHVQQSGWSTSRVDKALDFASEIFAQCDMGIEFDVIEVEASGYLRDFHSLSSHTLVNRLSLRAPVVYLVADSLRADPHEGEAFARSNTVTVPWLTDSAWIIADTAHPGVVLSHELMHILVNHGRHEPNPENLMHHLTSGSNTYLSPEQCMEARQYTTLSLGQ